MQVHFGAILRNDSSRGKEQKAVYQNVSSWIKADPALTMMMDKSLTPGTTLELTRKNWASKEFRLDVDAPTSHGTFAVLGKNLKHVLKRKKTIIADLMSTLLLNSHIWKIDRPNPMQALLDAAKDLPVETVRQILAGALQSMDTPSVYHYSQPVDIQPHLVEAPSMRLEHRLIMSANPKTIDVSYEDEKLLYAATQSVLNRVKTDPALLFALQDSVVPGLQMKVHLAQSGDADYQTLRENYPSREAVVNLSLKLTFPNGNTEKIALGDTMRSFYGRLPSIRNDILKSVARHAADPLQTLVDLNAFGREYQQPVSYLRLVEGSLLAWSKAQ